MSDAAPNQHADPEAFRRLAHRAVDWIADYWAKLDALPVRSPAAPGDVLRALPEHAPEQGLGDDASVWDAVFDDLDRIIVPGLTHWQSPRFFAYFPANSSPPAVVADLISSGLGVQGMIWSTSPACTELEIRVLDWLGELIGLPERFRSTSAGGGVIQGTASEAALVALVAAKRRAPPDRAPVVYASAEAHSSIVKAAMIAGVATGPEDQRGVRRIATDADGAMRIDELAAALWDDVREGRAPVMVAATLGTTGTTAVDDLAAVVKTVRDRAPGAWLHVDAAHAGAMFVCPEHRAMLHGVEHADSFCFNPHKWLLTTFDCSALYVADRRSLIDALSITPEYLRDAASESGAVTDFRDWQIPLGRRFRALKLWFVIRRYGAEGLREYIREHLRLAALFESLVRADERFEIPSARTMNLVCFRLRAGDGPSRDLLDRVNASGRAYLSHCRTPDGRFALRAAIGAVRTTERHVRETWELISGMAAPIR